MVKKLKEVKFEEFYETNEQVARTSPMMTHYHSSNPGERWMWQQKKNHIEKLLNFPIKNIVDLGCGDCGMLELIPKNIDYTGIDISPTQIGYAKNTIKKLKRKNAKVSVGDILNSQIKDNAYDAALLCDVVEHVLNPDKLFEETKRIVKENGTIIISIPNEFIWEAIRALLFRFPLRSPDHINSVVPSDIRKNFKKIEKTIYIPLPFSPQLSLIHIFSIKNVK
ncbi:MAG: class I SAM-dependent methyltransferase [Patescibacteria group bacterium]